jgi:hypothetical protein
MIGASATGTIPLTADFAELSSVVVFARVDFRDLENDFARLVVHYINRGAMLLVTIGALFDESGEVDSTHFAIIGEDFLAVGKIDDYFEHFIFPLFPLVLLLYHIQTDLSIDF